MALRPSRSVCCVVVLALASQCRVALCLECHPQWRVNSTSVCPYGHPFPFPKTDVTIPTELDLGICICVFYGITPFVIVGLSILDCTCRSVKNRGVGTREASFLGFLLIIVALNELVFKALARQERPQGSCILSCGFPSGHSTMAFGFFVLCFLDASYRVMPKVPLTVDAARDEARVMQGRRRRGQSFMGMTAREWLWVDLRAWTLMPLTAADILTSWDFTLYIFMWAVLLIPVPMSRIILKDHSPGQATIGALIGTVEAMVWFGCVRHFFLRRFNHLLGQRMGRVFIHNYPLPRFEVRSRCCRALASQSLVGHPFERTEVLARVTAEMEWYLQQPRVGRLANMAQTDEDAVFWEMEANNLKPLQRQLQTELQSLQSQQQRGSEMSSTVSTADGLHTDG